MYSALELRDSTRCLTTFVFNVGHSCKKYSCSSCASFGNTDCFQSFLSKFEVILTVHRRYYVEIKYQPRCNR